MIDRFIYLNGKVPRRGERLTDPEYSGHVEPPPRGDYGGIYGHDGDYVKVDIDDDAVFNELLSMCREKELRFNALKTSRGGHIYLKNVGLAKNRKQQKAVCGLLCEWKFSTSNDYVPIKRGGVMLEWVEGSPLNKDIDPLPDWLLPEAESTIPSGTRNNDLFTLGCSLRAKGATYEEIFSALTTANIERCRPPLSKNDIETISKQAAKYEQGNKTLIPDLDTQSVAELQVEKLPPVKWVVDDLLPQGLSIIASPPKYGQSWFVLDLCLSVAAGENFLKRKTAKSTCLYLALEDSKHRLKDRVNKLMFGALAPQTFFYTITAQTLDNGLIEQLEQFITTHPDTALIVIDTLQKVRGANQAKESGYAGDYREAGALKSFADKHGISLLLVHHLRKMGDDDPYNRISGTNGLLGAADTAMVLTKERRTNEEATFSVTGRDVEESQTIMIFDKKSYRWKVKGTVEELEEHRLALEYEKDPIVQTIKKLIESSGEWKGTMTDLLKTCLTITNTLPDEIDNADASGAMKLGKKIVPLTRMLWLRDKISCDFPNKHGGKKGREYRFYRKVL